MARILLFFVALGAIVASAAWFAPEGITKDILRFGVAMDVMIILLAASIGFLQWLAPTNPDGTPRS